ncbi:hypothetical protein [Archangium sp.]|uniref:hypothetical protein n=1 Tax=Archangium sp. TaxID=1872627 RepID=UPI002D311D61|nr:hypothetical protein [Archangium sp.]HYO53965.1 hypothetical protein [Archangium sp.]
MNPMPWRSAIMPVVLLVLSGCAGSGALLGAAVNTGIALGASAVSRSQGGCYASCPVGTTCNASTGYCDPLPCRGECDPFEQCIEDKLTYRCVARSPVNGDIIVNPAQNPAGPRSSEPRTDVPRTDVPRLTPRQSSEQSSAEPTP